MHKVKYYPVPKQVLNVLLPKHMYASFIEDAPAGWDAYFAINCKRILLVCIEHGKSYKKTPRFFYDEILRMVSGDTYNIIMRWVVRTYKPEVLPRVSNNKKYWLIGGGNYDF